MGDRDSVGSKASSGGTGVKAFVPIVVGVVLAVVGIGVFLFATKKPQVEVPEIVYHRTAEAEAELNKVGLKLGKVTTEKVEEIPFADIVYKQSIEQGSTVDEGTTVDVVVTEGKSLDESVKVPDLTGLTPEQAEEKLLEEFFIPQEGKQVYSDTVEPGKVCAQSVAAGTEARPFELSVTYSTSLGKEKVKVPELVGKTITDARTALHDAGLSCDTTVSYSDAVEKDKVISQSIGKDSEVEKGTTVTVEVSLGAKPATQVLVPNIFSYTLEEAKKALESAGLKYTYEGDEDGSVVAVTPPPNTKVDQGSTVKFTLEIPQNAQPADQQSQGGGQETQNSQENQSSQNASDSSANKSEVLYSQQQCQELALAVFNEDGQVENLKTSDLITGGGIEYYNVEFDKDGDHYTVQVDALEGRIVGAISANEVQETIYDSDGTVLSTRDL